MKTLSQIREASGGKEAYQKFFNSLLKKYGVDSPSELSGDKKKKFFNAVDKGWEGDDPSDANEHTIHLPNELTEKLRAGRGKLAGRNALDVDMDATDYKGGEKAFMRDMKKKFKVTIKMTSVGADITGNKADILKFIQSDFYGMDDSDIEALFPELLEAHADDKDDTDVGDYEGNFTLDEIHKPGHDDDDDEDDEDDLDPDTTTDIDELVDADSEDYYDSKQEKAPPGMEDVVKKLKADGNTDEEAFKIAWSIYNDAKRTKTRHGDAEHESTKKEGFFKKSYPVMNAGQKRKISAIAKKHSGNMQQAIKDIEKIKKGMSDNPDVMDILRKANEGLDLQKTGDTGTSKSVTTEKVQVDRRTKGFKEAMLRREKAKAKREAKKRAEAKKPKYDSNAYIDKGNYEYDGEVEDVIKRTSNQVMYGKNEDAAANAVAHSGVDMAPNAGKKKKKSLEVIKRANY